jgi:hypothetical protein
MSEHGSRTSMLLLAAGLLSPTPASSQQEPIEPDLAELGGGTDAKAANLQVTPGT